MKKLIAWILTLCLFLSLVPAVYANDDITVQAGDEKAQVLQAQINFDGYLHSAMVLRTEDGTILAPLKWMTNYGGLESKEYKGVWQYYKPTQEELRNYAKRWLIIPETRDYFVNWYFDLHMFTMFLANADDFSFNDLMELIMATREEEMKAILERYFSQKNTEVQRMGTNYMPMHRGKFTKMLSYADDYWVPMSELLSLLEISAGVSKDGRILCMKPSQTTLFDVLYEHGDEIEDLLFNSEDVVGNDFMAGAGWMVATLTGELYNIVPGLGREIDYKEIFTSYLQDNEVYLSTFNSQNDSKATYYKQVAESLKGAKTFYESVAKAHKPVYDLFLEDVTNPEFYTRYFEPAKKAGKAVDIAANAMTYIAAFSNQVEDHRLMLDAVYEYDADKTWPSYIAAQAIAATYKSKANLAILGTIDLTRKMVTEELSQEVYKKAFGGWYYAIEITKVLCKEDYDYVVNSSKINLISNTVQYSYNVFLKRFCNRQFSENGINNTRLCLMMSLIGSRHAYNTYYKGDTMKKETDSINKILSKLYQVGISRNENAQTTCKDRLDKYNEEIPKLQLIKNDPVVIAETDMLLNAIGNNNWKDAGWVSGDTDQDLYQEVSILAATGTGLKEANVDLNEDQVTVTSASPTDVFGYSQTEIIPEEQMVFGDAAEQLAALDAHFAQRPGLLCAMEYDLNGDDTIDRIYAVENAAQYWDRAADNPLNIPGNNLSLVVAEALDDGVMLRFYFDENYNGSGQECSYGAGELTVNGYAYTYQDEIGIPFRKIGLVRLQSIYSYLSGEVKFWEQARVNISYPDDSNHNKMNLEVDGLEFFVHAEKDGDNALIHELRVDAQGKPVPVIGQLTTNNTAKQIIEALSLVNWDNHQSIDPADNLSVVMGPYPLMGGTEEAYECSVLWVMPDGDIYQLTMQLHEESLDTSPYALNVTSLKKPKVSVHELLLKTPDQVAGMLSGYTADPDDAGEVIYAEGWIGDASVEVQFEALNGTFVAQRVEVRFAEDTVSVFPDLDSSTPAEDAKKFLQPNMDWKLQNSKSEGDKDLYYTTNFCFDENSQAFWYVTMLTEYTWTADDGYSEGAFGGITLTYSGSKDDSGMSWYWALYG